MKKRLAGTMLAAAMLLSACSFGASAEERLSDAIGTIQEKEQPFLEAQEKMASLEKEEFGKFNAMMELTQEDREKLSVLADEANESAEERLDLLEKGKEALGKAEKELSGLDEIGKDEEAPVSEAVGKLKKSMADRYAAHEEFSGIYEKTAGLQKELYSLATDEQADFQAIQEKVKAVNDGNAEVTAAADAFNEATEAVNEQKKEAYAAISGSEEK
ncbi:MULTISPECIES: YkyA family protein [Bhargavaea]|uniref:YkyA family protein n=1 Tax=Bhargavaea changchunensis TaxID=2134037 RepID=A0ABW2NC29_9BACL|nr:YkyA family protein [Bhargavaea sp. CC-171006]